MLYKTIIAIAVVSVLAGGAVWVADGMHFFTKDREKIVTTTHDPLFGTAVEEVEWKENFQYGLLPDHAAVTHLHRSYSFVLGIATVAIAGSLVMLNRKRKASR